MEVSLLAITAELGETLHLAVVPGKATADIETIVGTAVPTEKTIAIERGDKLDGVDVHRAMNDLHDNGWTVFGTGFSV